jgi:hypothetical protein
MNILCIFLIEKFHEIYYIKESIKYVDFIDFFPYKSFFKFFDISTQYTLMNPFAIYTTLYIFGQQMYF